ncbi:MAG: hypothetical protein ABH821_01590 [archaeon]
MRGILMNNRGVFYSIGILVLLLSLMALNDFALKQKTALQQGVYYSTMIDRVSFKYENVQDNILDLIANSAQINLTFSDNNVSLSELLKNKKAQENCFLDLGVYKQFIFPYHDSLDLNINIEDFNSCMLVIEPGGIRFYHSGDDLESMHFDPEEILFNAYVVDVSFQNQPFEAIITDLNYALPEEQGIDLNVFVRECKKCDANFFSFPKLDPYKISTVHIDTAGGSDKDVWIYITPIGALEVTNNNSVSVELTAGIDFNVTPWLGLPDGLIEVRDNQFKVEKR